MEYTRLGRTGLEVSRIALGCMSFGDPDRGTHAWSLPEEPSRAIIKEALEAGVTFLDTANMYSAGSSEEIVGRAIRDFTRRDEIVLATKVFFPMRPGPGGSGLSRKAVLEAIDASLRRLGTDYVDLYQIHRWDPQTPIEETMEVLHEVVKSGRARYLGASSMWAWQFATAQHVAAAHGWTPFVSMQDHYNLIYREEEREMLPFCQATGVGVIPWSPLARGRLTRAWDVATARTATDEVGSRLYRDEDATIVGRVGDIATRRGVSMAQVAMAWLLGRPGVSAPIVGATKAEHLREALAALDVTLDAEEVTELEEPYAPHGVAGHV